MEEDDLETQILNKTDTDPTIVAQSIDLDGKIKSAIEGKHIDVNELNELLLTRRKSALSQVLRGKKSHKEKQEEVTEAFKGAQEAAERNRKAAKNNLGILTNTGRRNQFFGGFAAIGLGLAKGIYDIVQFWDEDIQTGANTFNLINDASLTVVGVYGLKQAYENGGAIAEYNQALAIQYLVQQASQLEAPKQSKK